MQENERERRSENEGNFNAKKQSSKAGQGEIAPMVTRVLHSNPYRICIDSRVWLVWFLPHELKYLHVIKPQHRQRQRRQ